MMKFALTEKSAKGKGSKKKKANRRQRSASDPLALMRENELVLEKKSKSVRKLKVEEYDDRQDETDRTECDLTESEHTLSHHSRGGSFHSVGSPYSPSFVLEYKPDSGRVPGDEAGVVQRMARARQNKLNRSTSHLDEQNDYSRHFYTKPTKKPARRAKLLDPDLCSSPTRLKQSAIDTRGTPGRNKNIPLHQERLQQAKKRMVALSLSLQEEMSDVEHRWRSGISIDTASTSDDPMVMLEMAKKGIPTMISWETQPVERWATGEESVSSSQHQKDARGPHRRVERRRSTSLPPLGGGGDNEVPVPSDSNADGDARLPTKKTRRGGKKNKKVKEVKSPKHKQETTSRGRPESINRGRSGGRGRMERRRSVSLPPPPPFQERAEVKSKKSKPERSKKEHTRTERKKKKASRRDGQKRSKSSPNLKITDPDELHVQVPSPLRSSFPASKKENGERKTKVKKLRRSQSTSRLEKKGSLRVKGKGRESKKQARAETGKQIQSSMSKQPSTTKMAVTSIKEKGEVLSCDARKLRDIQYSEMMAFAQQCRQTREELEAENSASSLTAYSITSLQNIPVQERQALRQERLQNAMARVATKQKTKDKSTGCYREDYTRSNSLHW